MVRCATNQYRQTMSYSVLAPIYEQLMDDVLYTIYLDLILKYSTPSKVLELGCGTAYLSRELAKLDYDATAMDNNEEMLEMASYYAGNDGVNITFLQHNITEAITGSYDLIIMPVDVINHLNTKDEVHQLFKHVFNSLNNNGLFIFDSLKCTYIESLIGHNEAILIEGYDIEWEVKSVNLHCAHQHQVTVNKVTETHITKGYLEEDLYQMISAFNVIDKIELEERIIYVLKQKEK